MKFDLRTAVAVAGLACTVVSAWVEMRVAVSRLEAKATAIEHRIQRIERDVDPRTASAR